MPRFTIWRSCFSVLSSNFVTPMWNEKSHADLPAACFIQSSKLSSASSWRDGQHISMSVVVPPTSAALLPLHVQVTEERFAPAIKWKPRHRSRHADVDANHASFYTVFKLTRRFARACEDRCAIAVGRFVRQLNGLVQIFHVHHVQHRTENLLLRHSHSGLHVVQNRGADIQTIW